MSQTYPNRNYGGATTLQLEASPVLRAYIRFDIKGLKGIIKTAQLRVFAMTNSPAGYDLRIVSDSTWQEKTITYKNAPPVGSVAATSQPVSANTWVSIDVTRLISGNGKLALALTSPNGGPLRMASRESGRYAPQIIVEAAPANATLTQTATPRKTKAPSATPRPPTPTSTTASSSATHAPTKTYTPSPTPTATTAPPNTATPQPTATFSSTPSPTATSSATATPTPSAAATATPTQSASKTPSPSATAAPTFTRTATPSAAGNMYFVASDGSDSNPGTSADRPWQTLTAVQSHHFAPGDTINFARGSTWTGLLDIVDAGEPSNPITFQAYGMGPRPILRNPDPNERFAIIVEGPWIVVQGLLVRDAVEAGIWIPVPANHTVIRDVEATAVGIGVEVASQYNLITDSSFHDLHMVVNTPGGKDDYGAEGVVLMGSNNEVSVQYNDQLQSAKL